MYMYTKIDDEYKIECGECYDSCSFYTDFRSAKREMKADYRDHLPTEADRECGVWLEDGHRISAEVIYLEMLLRPCDPAVEAVSKTRAFAEACEDEMNLSKAQLCSIVQDLIEGKSWDSCISAYGGKAGDPCMIAVAISKGFAEAGKKMPEKLKGSLPEVKEYLVTARMTTYPTIKVYAVSREAAISRAADIDGGDFEPDDTGDWDIIDAEEIS